MGKRTVRVFDPKPLTTGAKIGWIQHHMDGTTTERTGVVIDRAPSVDGAVVTCWVKPDVPLETDLYWALLVGKANARSVPAHFWLTMETRHSRNYARKGELYASDDGRSPTGYPVASARERCVAA